jgi:hypothetical protein
MLNYSTRLLPISTSLHPEKFRSYQIFRGRENLYSALTGVGAGASFFTLVLA